MKIADALGSSNPKFVQQFRNGAVGRERLELLDLLIKCKIDPDLEESETEDSEAVFRLPSGHVPRFDPIPNLVLKMAEQLRTPEEMAAYLDAWLTEAPDDAVGIARALGDIARAKGMSQVARDAGLSRESLYKALGENGNPSFATILKVARALGVRLHAEPT
jgi:probable addiction module antidote protein